MNESPRIDEDRLLAYVDGELDAQAAAQVEAALARDPAAARFVAEQRALQARLQAAFRPVLEEALPPRLLAAARGATLSSPPPAPSPKVPGLAALRRRLAAALGGRGAPWAWAGAGMAASLLLGLLLGQRLLPGGGDALVAAGDGGLIAGGALAQALSTQPADAQRPGDPVRLGPSFVSREGPYCRSFVLAAQDAAGLACRTGRGWELQLLAPVRASAGGGYRQAAAALPAPVLAAIDERIEGESLDAEAERQALRQEWRRPAAPPGR